MSVIKHTTDMDSSKEEFRVVIACEAEPSERNQLFKKLLHSEGFHAHGKPSFMSDYTGGLAVKDDGAQVLSSGDPAAAKLFAYFWFEGTARAFAPVATAAAKKLKINVKSEISRWDAETLKWIEL